MKIVRLIPYGFCFGVINAYNKTMNIINNNPDRKIYMLGWLVHNNEVINELSKKGVIILDDKNTSRYELVKSINDFNAILILSAHGTPKDVIELAREKKLEIHDLTCKFVYKTHEIIINKINEGYDVLFIGKKNHPETIAILNINQNIRLIESEDDINKLSIKNKKIFCTNQTTLGKIFFQKTITLLRSKYPYIEVENDICDATNLRQEAVLNMSSDIDICIIIGDARSSNCNELYKLAKIRVKDSYIVQNLDDLENIDFSQKKKCAITAAASTPSWLIDNIVEKLENF